MVRRFEYPGVPFTSMMDTDWIQKITVKGRAPVGADRFTIYLQRGDESEPDEVAFVLDVRFDYGKSQNKIVTNYKVAGCWQTEESGECPFLFCYDRDFKIKIYVEEDYFRVKVDDEDLLEYGQKLSMKSINCLRVENNVILTKVKLE